MDQAVKENSAASAACIFRTLKVNAAQWVARFHGLTGDDSYLLPVGLFCSERPVQQAERGVEASAGEAEGLRELGTPTIDRQSTVQINGR